MNLKNRNEIFEGTFTEYKKSNLNRNKKKKRSALAESNKSLVKSIET